MALTADANYNRRGMAATRNEFGYPVAPGEKVFRGSLVGLNSSGQMVRMQTGTPVAFVGVADRNLDNSAGGVASATLVVAMKGTWAIPLSGATVSNTNAAVYASDDNTLTLTAGSLKQVGTLVGIEGAATYINILGS